MTTDCLIIGFKELDFEKYVKMLRQMGTHNGAYRDLNLAFIDYLGKPYRCLDILNHFLESGAEPSKPAKLLHNSDFLWPVITYLGSYLKKRNYTFDYINVFNLEQDALREKLENNDILTIAITTTLYVSVHPVIDIINFIKKYNRKARIIVGGPFIYNLTLTNQPAIVQSMFKYMGADFYVIGSEGEAALAEIIGALKNERPLDTIDNIAYQKDNAFVLTPTVKEDNSLTEEAVDYSLFPPERVGRFVSLRTAKSCPFACSYCGFHQRAGKYAYMDVGRIEAELNSIRAIGGVTSLTFIDDTLNVPQKRYREFLHMMIKNRYGFKWNAHYRCDHGDEETIALMKEAGCEGVFLGVESGNDLMLQLMNKTSRRSDYLKTIPLLRGAGIWTHANFIVGFPTETDDTVRDTISLIEETKPDTYRAQLWYADPTTPIWKRKDEFGVKGTAFNWTHETMDAGRACDWVEKMFLDIENSLWLPQFGFELWSVFYLQRLGMTREQLKQFMAGFNNRVKQKLKNTPGANQDEAVNATFNNLTFLKNLRT